MLISLKVLSIFFHFSHQFLTNYHHHFLHTHNFISKVTDTAPKKTPSDVAGKKTSPPVEIAPKKAAPVAELATQKSSPVDVIKTKKAAPQTMSSIVPQKIHSVEVNMVKSTAVQSKLADGKKDSNENLSKDMVNQKMPLPFVVVDRSNAERFKGNFPILCQVFTFLFGKHCFLNKNPNKSFFAVKYHRDMFFSKFSFKFRSVHLFSRLSFEANSTDARTSKRRADSDVSDDTVKAPRLTRSKSKKGSYRFDKRVQFYWIDHWFESISHKAKNRLHAVSQ